jgi:hypothetical protein
MLPDPQPAAAALRSIIRVGQSNFEFASIWEQRKTREALIGGSARTIAETILVATEAIRDARREVTTVLRPVSDTTDSRLASAVKAAEAVAALQERLTW